MKKRMKIFTLLGKIQQNDISAMVINGHRNPVGAESRFRTAVECLIAESQNTENGVRG